MGVTVSAEVEEPTTGFHVLKVKENSPAALAGIEPFFDYIVAAGGQRLSEQNSLLFDMLQSFIDKELKLTLYNSKSQEFREVSIIPTTKWGGDGVLGCSIRFCNFEHASEHVWNVMSVYEGSPASDAGLRPNHDYIIGTPDVIIKDKNDLFMLVDQHTGKPLRFYVYNWETDKTREVSIVPDPHWGGEGSLGCDIGFGYLHRIPRVKAATAIDQDKPASVTLADFGSANKANNNVEKTIGTPSNSKNGSKISSSSLMEASTSMVSLPDVTANSENKTLNVKSDGGYTLEALKTKSQNNSAVKLK